MNTEEKLKELELEIEEIKKDLGTKTISTRGFQARLYKSGGKRPDLEIHLGCRGLSPKKLLENGDYYQEYNAYYKYNEYNGCIVLDMKFNKNNEIIDCKKRPFKCPISEKKGDVVELEFYEAID